MTQHENTSQGVFMRVIEIFITGVRSTEERKVAHTGHFLH